MAHIHGLPPGQLRRMLPHIGSNLRIADGNIIAFLCEVHIAEIIIICRLHQFFSAAAKGRLCIVFQALIAPLCCQFTHGFFQTVKVGLVHFIGPIAGLVLIEKIVHRQICRHVFSVEVIGLVWFIGLLGDGEGILGPLQQKLLGLPVGNCLTEKIMLPA